MSESSPFRRKRQLRAERDDHPSLLFEADQHASIVMERLSAIERNMQAAEIPIAETWAARHGQTEEYKKRLTLFWGTQQMVRNFTTEVRRGPVTSPWDSGTAGINIIQTVLRRHAEFAPELFRGYVPVDQAEDWSAPFFDGARFSFASQDERLIVFALETASSGQYPYTDYDGLRSAGIAAGVMKV